MASFIFYPGLSADVYSFGIVMWEMLTLKLAFHNYSRERHFREVVVGGKRPKILTSWPYIIRHLLGQCWAPVPSERPTSQAVCQLIKNGVPNMWVDSERSDELLKSERSIRGNRENIEHDLISDSISKSVRTR